MQQSLWGVQKKKGKISVRDKSMEVHRPFLRVEETVKDGKFNG